MTTYGKFRDWLLAAALAAVLTLSGSIWNTHVSTANETASATSARLQRVETELGQLRDIVIRLDTYIAQQQQLNEQLAAGRR